MTSSEYVTGFVSDSARRAIAIFRTRPAMNSSMRPGCSLALTPLFTKYQRPNAPTAITRSTSSTNAFSTGLMRTSPLRLPRELRGIRQELLAAFLGAEVVGLTLEGRLRGGGRIHHQSVD